MATTSGRTTWAWATSRSTDRWAPRATTRNRPGSSATTSSVWVPIEPVDPTMLTVTWSPGAGAADIRSAPGPVVEGVIPPACPMFKRY